MKKYIAIAVSTMLIGSFACPVMASSHTEVKAMSAVVKNVNRTRQAYIRGDISIMLGENEVHFKTSSGKAVYPIIYQNRTYLPLRAIGELMGKNVNWDASTKTITIAGNRTSTSSNKPNPSVGKQSIMVEERADFTIIVGDTVQQFTGAFGETLNPLLYEGSTYLPLRAISEIMGSDIQWDGRNLKVIIQADGLVTDADSFKPDENQMYITREKAKEIALDDAAKKASDVAFTKAKMETEDGKVIYQIEFYSAKIKYEYEIDATNGKILSKDLSVDDPNIDGNELYITREKAKEIALDDAGKKASEVTFTKAKVDTEGGKVIYEIKFYSGKIEYEYEIDATNGKILSKDVDTKDAKPDSKPDKGISLEEAKKLALKHAGVSEKDVIFTKANVDYDDGKQKYEFEFIQGKMQYECDVDAQTGKILEYDTEYDD